MKLVQLFIYIFLFSLLTENVLIGEQAFFKSSQFKNCLIEGSINVDKVLESKFYKQLEAIVPKNDSSSLTKFDSIDNLFHKKNYKIEHFTFAIELKKETNEIPQFSSKNYNFICLTILNKKITFNELFDILKNSGLDLTIIKINSLSVLETKIDGQKLYLYTENNFILGGFKENLSEFLKKTKGKIPPIDYDLLEQNNADALLTLNISQIYKKEINLDKQSSLGIYGIDTNIFKNISKIRIELKFKDNKAFCSALISTNNKKNSDSLYLLLKQFIPIVKYKLLTTDNGKFSNLANSINFKKMSESKVELNASFTASELYFIINSK